MAPRDDAGAPRAAAATADGAASSGAVREICLCASMCVDYVELRLRDGSVNSYGDQSGGVSRGPWVLEASEHIVAVEQIVGLAYLGYALFFELSSNRRLGYEGHGCSKKVQLMRFEAARGTQICGLVFHQSVLEEIITVPVDGAASGGAERHDCAEGDARDEGVSHPSMMNVTKAAQGSLCLEWRKVGKPRGRPGLQPAPARCLEGFEALLGTRFRSRGLDDLLSLEGTFEEEGELWRRYRCLNAAPTPEVGSEVSYHGTWWYALRSVVTSGIMLESNDSERGHEIEGVYCTPLISTARGYARPQVLFGDGAKRAVAISGALEDGSAMDTAKD